jgi:hypothetical protein
MHENATSSVRASHKQVVPGFNDCDTERVGADIFKGYFKQTSRAVGQTRMIAPGFVNGQTSYLHGGQRAAWGLDKSAGVPTVSARRRAAPMAIGLVRPLYQVVHVSATVSSPL